MKSSRENATDAGIEEMMDEAHAREEAGGDDGERAQTNEWGPWASGTVGPKSDSYVGSPIQNVSHFL